MNNRYPNPWNFSNSDKNLISPNQKMRIEYGALGEIAMSAPLGADCYLIIDEKEKVNISNWAGGPAIWNTTSDKAAFPIWTKGRSQQLRLIDLHRKKIVTFARIFRVLELEKFEHSILKGMDSPIYKPEPLSFDIQTETIHNETELKIETIFPD